jgi:hypothetical protein
MIPALRAARPLTGFLAVTAALALSTALAHVPLFERMRFCVFLFTVCLIARGCGFGYALATAALGAAVLDYYFIVPKYSLAIGSALDAGRLGVFLLLAVAVARLAAPATTPVVAPPRPLYPLPFAQGLERAAQCLDALFGIDGGVAAFAVDARGRVTHWSAGAVARTGRAAAEVIGQSLEQIVRLSAGADPLRGAQNEPGAVVALVLRRAGQPDAEARARVFPLWQVAVAAVSGGSEAEVPVELGGYLILLNHEG